MLLALLVLSGCGFSPVYKKPDIARGQNAPTAETEELRYIEIEQIQDRAGQELRNALLEIMPDAKSPTRYRLSVQLSEYIDDFGIRRDTTATFARLTVTAQFQLFALPVKSNGANEPLLTGTLRAINSYNILASTFATLSAEEDARSRASRQLADDIKLRLGAYFKNSD